MARRAAARRGARVLVVLFLGGVLFISLLVFAAGVPVAQLRAGACGAVGSIVMLDRVLPACSGPARASRELAVGRAAANRRAYREALGHYREAAAAAPDLPAAHVARGETAQILGEYEEALAAFQRAAAIAPSPEANLRVGAAAERQGRVDVAIQTLENASGPWRQHAVSGARAAVVNFATCVPVNWSNPARLWQTCVTGSRDAYGASFDASRDIVPRGIFRLLVEEGRYDQALTFARERGWVRPDVEYCGRHSLPIDEETSALLAMLTQPERADCVLATAVDVADGGGARLARLMLLERVARSPQVETRQNAQWVLRYRLPDHDVPRLAEALNIAASRLQHVHDAADEALVVFQKSIDADPRFSWPYHNIGRVYMARGDFEQARVWLGRALAVNPDHWRALYSYGVANANLKRWRDALFAYRQALAISPNDARLHASVGWTLIELGHEPEAERELKLAVRLDPSLQAERSWLNSRYGADVRSGPTPSSAR
jgi:tetratricopeptide (TPR) repeat protein